MATRLVGRQLAIMKLLWSCGEATVADVQAALEVDPPLAYSTVATVMARMEHKGLLTHREVGRTYYYQAAVSEARIGRSVVREMIERIFDGSPAALVCHLLESEEVDAAELERIKEFVRQHEAIARRRKPEEDR